MSVDRAVGHEAKEPNLADNAKIAARVPFLGGTFRQSLWGLLLTVVVIGGIYTGIFTPTEAAAMSAVDAFFVAVFVYKDLTFKNVPKVLLDSANMSAMLLYIFTTAVMFSFLMISEQIPKVRAPIRLPQALGMMR